MRLFAIILVAVLPAVCRYGVADGPVCDIAECLGEDWTDERLRFPVTLPEGLDPQRICVSADGEVLQAQFAPGPSGGRDGTVSFVGSLPAFSRRTWVLREKPIDMPASDLLVRVTGTDVSLGTSRIAVRCPVGTRQWEGGIPIAEVSPPVMAVSLIGGPWLACGQLAGRLRVISMESRIVEDGPVSAKVVVRYCFAGGGEWSVGMEAIAGQEVVLVTEELDNEAGSGLLESIQPAGAPEGNYVMKAYGQRLRDRGSSWEFRLDGLDVDRIAWQPMGNMWPTERFDSDTWGDFGVPREAGPIMTLHPAHGEWWLNVSPWAGFYRRGGEAYLGILALQAGLWRALDENAIVVEKTASGSIQAVLPITTGARRWALYAASRHLAAPPQRAEAPPAERPGRDHVRPPQLAALKYGLLPLDTVKEWNLRFADPPGLTYPFLVIRQSELPRLRARASARPEIMKRLKAVANAWSSYARQRNPQYPFYPSWITSSMMLEDLYLATGRDEYVDAMAALLEERLRYHVHQAKSGIGTIGYRLGHDYGMFHVAIGVLPQAIREADLVLGSPKVSAARKANIRALLAFWAELLTSGDYQPPGRNNGNTDMVACRDVMIGAIGCLFPGHPLAKAWRTVAAARIDQVLEARHHLPGVTQDEWYGHLTLDLCVWSAVMLKRLGDRDFFQDERLRDGLDFYGQLLVPLDPRYGHGYVVPFGNGQAQWNRSAQCGLAAAASAAEDPVFAGRMMWYWERAGRPLNLKFLATGDLGIGTLAWIDESIEPCNPRLASTHLDGWGFVFRSRCGMRDESFLAVQAGKPGGLSLYNAEGGMQYHALGVPMCLVYGIRSYDVAMHGGQSNLTLQRWMANRPSFGGGSERGEGTGKVVAWASSANADYASAEWAFSHFERIVPPQPREGPDSLVLSSPPEPAPASSDRSFQTSSPVRWRRQILFVKPRLGGQAPYAVIRDDVRSPVPWDSNTWCLASSQQVTDHGGFFTGKFGVNLAAIPLTAGGNAVSGGYGPRQSFAGDYRQLLYQIRLPTEARSFTTLLYPWRKDDVPPEILPDEELQGVRIVFPGEAHIITSRPHGMALVRESRDASSITLWGGIDTAECPGGRVTITGTRDLKAIADMVFTEQAVRGEIRGVSREIDIQSAASARGELRVDEGAVNEVSKTAEGTCFTSGDGVLRFHIE